MSRVARCPVYIGWFQPLVVYDSVSFKFLNPLAKPDDIYYRPPYQVKLVSPLNQGIVKVITPIMAGQRLPHAKPQRR